MTFLTFLDLAMLIVCIVRLIQVWRKSKNFDAIQGWIIAAIAWYFILTMRK